MSTDPIFETFQSSDEREKERRNENVVNVQLVEK